MYIGFGGHPQVELLRQQNQIIYSGKAIVDEQTGDRYLCRSMDNSYFKHVTDEYLNKDTISIYQVCLVFPPLGKHVEKAYIGTADDGDRMGKTFNPKELPHKARVITK